jgi:hypothetical protein
VAATDSQWCGYLVDFTTVYQDYAWLITMYPTGFPDHETINQPDFRLHHNHQSLEAAYGHHQAQIQDFAQMHGAPFQFETMANYLSVNPIFRQRYGALMLRRGYQLAWFNSNLYMWLAVWCFLSTLVSIVFPKAGLALTALGMSVLCITKSWNTAVLPRKRQIFQIIVTLLLILTPLTFLISPWIGVVHVLLTILLFACYPLKSKPAVEAGVISIIEAKTDEELEQIRQQKLHGD